MPIQRLTSSPKSPDSSRLFSPMHRFLTQFDGRIDCHFLAKEDDREVLSPSVRLWQVHGNRTIVTREPMESTEKADGVITDRVGLALLSRAADCQNFAIYAPKHHIGGVLHAGWRGMLLEAIPHFFATLKDNFDVDASECFVACGPSLCTTCAEYRDSDHELRQKVDPQYVEGDCVNLQQIATDQLVKSGVHTNSIERHPDCTRCRPETYLTYRGGDRSEVESGVSNILVLRLL